MEICRVVKETAWVLGHFEMGWQAAILQLTLKLFAAYFTLEYSYPDYN